MIDGYSPDHLIFKPETSYCVMSAAHRFSLPPDGILSVLLTEGGSVGMAKKNTNGTFDFGPMQINSLWLKPKSPLYGFVTEDKLKNDLCSNIHAAAWIIATHYNKSKDMWKAIGWYHSPYNPQFAQTYRLRVNSRLSTAKKIMAMDQNYRFNARSVTQILNTKNGLGDIPNSPN